MPICAPISRTVDSGVKKFVKNSISLDCGYWFLLNRSYDLTSVVSEAENFPYMVSNTSCSVGMCNEF